MCARVLCVAPGLLAQTKPVAPQLDQSWTCNICFAGDAKASAETCSGPGPGGPVLGGRQGNLSVEEKEKLCHLVQQYSGRRQMWTKIAKLIGRPRTFCRLSWTELRIGDKRKYGKWSSEEENRLRLLVREQIAARKEKEAAETKLGLKQMSCTERAAVAILVPSSGVHYRDRLNFEHIAEKLGSRTPKMCRDKWYRKLSPSMFSSGEWALGDDIAMIRALQSAGCKASVEEYAESASGWP
eukprot:gene22023-29085_t